jgi:hypothetical protein
LAVTNVGSGTHNELGEYYADASVTLNGPVAVDTLFYVNVTTSIAGVIAVAVTIYAGFDYGSGSQYAGMGDIGGSLGACIASCDNPSVDLTGFTC